MSYVPFINMEQVGFMTYTAASHWAAVWHHVIHLYLQSISLLANPLMFHQVEAQSGQNSWSPPTISCCVAMAPELPISQWKTCHLVRVPFRGIVVRSGITPSVVFNLLQEGLVRLHSQTQSTVTTHETCPLLLHKARFHFPVTWEKQIFLIQTFKS